MKRVAMALLAGLLALPSYAAAQSCVGNPVAVQILGSGGPGLNKDRASTGYLLWDGAQARILVDMGGGSFHRYAEAQAKFTDLSMILVSHLHPDHISDLPALLWSSRNSRSDTLPIVGPSGNDAAPSISTFLSRQFDGKTGAFQVLGAVTTPTQGVVRLDASAVDVTKSDPSTVYERDGVKLTAMGIPHANIPALAYRVQTRDASIVFSTDQNGTNPKFVDFARGADVLVMHMAIAAGGTSPLHAAPGVVGRIAKDAGVKRLIVSHIGQYDLNAALAELKAAYSGPLTVGADLQCTQVR